MKKIILSGGHILLCQAIIKITPINLNWTFYSFTIFYVGGETIIAIQDEGEGDKCAKIRERIVEFLDSSHLTLNLQQYY